jgi:uncharacterized protein (DUF1697 family)
MTVAVALLRAVNVGGRALKMADLLTLARDLGFAEPRTLLQSGNLVFVTPNAPDAALEGRLEAKAKARFGFQIDIVVRSAAEWRTLLAKNPFLDAARDDPSHLLVMPLKTAPPKGALDALRAAIKGREEVALAARDAYLVYPEGIGRSKLTIQVIERHLRTHGTARNWNTALKLAAMCAGG